MIITPPVLPPVNTLPANGDPASAIASRLGRDSSGRSSLVEIATSPARLPVLQLGETVSANITDRLADGKVAATIKGESFVLNLPSQVLAKLAGNELRLGVANLSPLVFEATDFADAALIDASKKSQVAEGGGKDPGRLSELGKAVANALQNDEGVFLKTLSQPEKLPQLQRGELVSARLAEKFADGSAMVLVKNSAFKLQLPPGTTIGKESAFMRVTQTSPQVAFSLLSFDALPDEKSSPVTFTTAGKYLTSLLDVAGQQPMATAKTENLQGKNHLAAVILHQEPLLSNPSLPDDAHLQLQKTVEKSGLFYESHQKAWVDGRLSLDELRQEPQAKISFQAASSTGHLSELGQLVQRQLDVNEQKPLVFQGMAWPGQAVQWEIHHDDVDEREARQSESELAAWYTRLQLELPLLGGLAAKVRMVGKELQLNFTAESEASQLILKHRDVLEQRLAASGLTLASLQVKQSGHED